jgi:hypothetical protein
LNVDYDILRVVMSEDRPNGGGFVVEIDLLARQPDWDVEAVGLMGRRTS